MASPFQSFPILETSRLVLRQLNENDVEMVFFLRSDTTVNAYIKRKGAKNLKDAIHFMEKIENGYINGDNIHWAVCKKDDDKMIGSICLWNFSQDLKTGEVGYSLHPKFQNQGIMTEALKSIIAFGFYQLNFEHLLAFTHKRNNNSLQLLKKNGFYLHEESSDPSNENNIIYGLDRE